MSRRHVVSAVLVVAFEVWLYTRYAALGAQFHFWLHTLFGAALGLAVLTLLRLLRRRREGKVAAWEAGWIGQLYSVLPDILFLVFGVLHMMWMNVFALHISLHFVPRPLLTMWLLFTLTLIAYGLAMSGRRRGSIGVLAGFVATTVVALAVAPAAPSTIGEVRGHDGLALMCPVLTHPPGPGARSG